MRVIYSGQQSARGRIVGCGRVVWSPSDLADVISVWDPHYAPGLTLVNPGTDNKITRLADPISGYDIGITTTAFKPTWQPNVLNGNAGIFYDASANLTLRTDSANISVSTWSVIQVVKMSSAANSFLWTLYDGGSDTSFVFTGINQSMRSTVSATKSEKNVSAGAGWLNTSPHVVISQYDGAHASHLLFIDNAAVATTDVTAADPGSTAIARQFFLGSSAGIASPIRGHILYTALVGRAITADERTASQQWAAWRFAI